jgi:transcriptional regulator with XRE-family HTH domain
MTSQVRETPRGRGYARCMQTTFGAQLRAWRSARQLSQEALAERARVSARHLSFVENGRAQPSRELVLALAGAMDVPLRDQNVLLHAAGYAAEFKSASLDGEELRHLRRAVEHLLRQQEPFGAIVVDRLWNLVEMNAGAARLFARFPPRSAAGVAASRNVLTATLHPDALRPHIVNWHEVAAHLIARMHRDIAAAPGDEERRRLLASCLALPDVPADWRVPSPGRNAAPFVPVHLRGGGLELRLFTMLTSVGTPLDVTAAELHVESYFPADDATEAALRSLTS